MMSRMKLLACAGGSPVVAGVALPLAPLSLAAMLGLLFRAGQSTPWGPSARPSCGRRARMGGRLSSTKRTDPELSGSPIAAARDAGLVEPRRVLAADVHQEAAVVAGGVRLRD